MAAAKIVDCFLYNGELIVELRLQTLYSSVDLFVIAECVETFTGRPKEALFFHQNAALFAPFMDKIVFVQIPSYPTHDAWARESYNRSYPLKTVFEWLEGHPFILICSDCDELTNAGVIAQLKNDYYRFVKPVKLDMTMHYYNFKWMLPGGGWRLAVVVNDICLRSMSLQQCRKYNTTDVIPNAGWHFSYFMDIPDLKRKIASFSHTEFDTDQFKSDTHLQECLETGKDLFCRKNNMVPTTREVLAGFPDGWVWYQGLLETLQAHRPLF
jgi:beta-1,4-mannosyl-glycoprotein beta-1,4-N-acetylglucosaminyltransferase